MFFFEEYIVFKGISTGWDGGEENSGRLFCQKKEYCFRNIQNFDNGNY